MQYTGTHRMKARSRLQEQTDLQPLAETKNTVVAQHRAELSAKYIRHLPLLLVSIPFYSAVYYVLTNIYPHDIQNIFLIDSYGPFQILLFIANLFFFSYILLSTRRGFFVAVWILLVLFLKLQMVEMSLLLIFGLAAFLLSVEFLVITLSKLRKA